MKSIQKQNSNLDNFIFSIDEDDNIRLSAAHFDRWLIKTGFFKRNGQLYLAENGTYTEITHSRFVQILKGAILDFATENKINKDICFNALFSNTAYSYFLENNFVGEPPQIINDTSKEIRLHFNNCVVEITRDSITERPHSDYDGVFQKALSSERDFHRCDNYEDSTIVGIYRKMAGDEDNFLTLKHTIGYLISKHKAQKKALAIWLTDQGYNIAANGGRGKSFFSKLFKEFRTTVNKNLCGKKINDRFALSRINEDTNVFVLEETNNKYNMTELNEFITGEVEIEKKNKDERTLDFLSTPKVLIISNWQMGYDVNNGSTERRLAVLGFSDHFQKNRMCDLFPDCDDDILSPVWKNQYPEEMISFDNFVVHCCQLHLQDPDYLIKLKPSASDSENRLKQTIGDDFYSWFENYLDDKKSEIEKYGKLPRKNISADYENVTGDYKMSSCEFKKNIEKYCSIKGIGFSMKKSNSVEYFLFSFNDLNLKNEVSNNEF